MSGHLAHPGDRAEERQNHPARNVGHGESELPVELARDLDGPQQRWDSCLSDVPILS